MSAFVPQQRNLRFIQDKMHSEPNKNVRAARGQKLVDHGCQRSFAVYVKYVFSLSINNRDEKKLALAVGESLPDPTRCEQER